MDILEELKNDLTNEYTITKKFLANYPADKNNWKPHGKSMKTQDLTTHIVELFSWPTTVFQADYLDFAQIKRNDNKPTSGKEFEKLLDYLYTQSMEALERASPKEISKMWQLRQGDTVLSEISKYQAFMMNIRHITHHRAQLGVYYRLNDIPVPSTIGPSADEK